MIRQKTGCGHVGIDWYRAAESSVCTFLFRGPKVNSRHKNERQRSQIPSRPRRQGCAGSCSGKCPLRPYGRLLSRRRSVCPPHWRESSDYQGWRCPGTLSETRGRSWNGLSIPGRRSVRLQRKAESPPDQRLSSWGLLRKVRQLRQLPYCPRGLLGCSYHASLSLGKNFVDGVDPARCPARNVTWLVSLNNTVMRPSAALIFSRQSTGPRIGTFKGSSLAVPRWRQR